MIPSLQASLEGLALVDRARLRRGWTKTSTARWWQEAHTSRATLRRFWQRDRIQQDIFIAICQTVGIENWQAIAEGGVENASEGFLTEETSRFEWDEAPDLQQFDGRNSELAQLEEWVLRDRSRLLLMTGMAGIGKTALALVLAERIQSHFSRCIWRSAHHLTLPELLDRLLCAFGRSAPSEMSQGIQELLQLLKQQRCLLVLDGLDNLDQSEADWVRRLASDRHQSCVIITRRERPAAMDVLFSRSIRGLTLQGLSIADAVALLQHRGLQGERELLALAKTYHKHPLALHLASSLIHTILNGNVKAFLQQNLPIPEQLKALLTEQWSQLSLLEQDIAYWFVIWQEPIALSRLQSHLFNLPDPGLVLSGIATLERHSLLEKRFTDEQPSFTLHSLVMAIVTDQLIDQAVQEISQAIQTRETQGFRVVRTHGLLRPGTDDIQGDRFLSQIQAQLHQRWGEELPLLLEQLLSSLQERSPRSIGYAAYNLAALTNRLF